MTVVAVLVAALLIAAAIALLATAPPQVTAAPPPPPAPPPRSRALVRRPAVVLVHGVCGFDALGLGRVRVDYFRGVAACLEAAGVDVVTARLPPLASVPARAAALAALLDALPHDRLSLIAHSMGGLDARWALADGAAADRVDALITLGTPHRGTPVADLLARLRPLAPAIDWLTTRRLAGFDREVPDRPGVRYACVVGATAERRRVHPLLRPSHAYLMSVAGPSDGLVPVSSQRRGEVLLELEVDHWAQVGWGGHDAGAALARAYGIATSTSVGASTLTTSAGSSSTRKPLAPPLMKILGSSAIDLSM